MRGLARARLLAQRLGAVVDAPLVGPVAAGVRVHLPAALFVVVGGEEQRRPEGKQHPCPAVDGVSDAFTVPRIDVDIVEYLQQPPTAAELAEICDLLDISPLQLMRTQEALFGELGLSRDNGYSDAQWLAVLAEHPRLIERPVLVYNGKAAIGRPPENVLDIL